MLFRSTEQASIVCEQIEAAVSFAESEEDLRIEFEKAIEVFRKEADLPELKGHHGVLCKKQPNRRGILATMPRRRSFNHRIGNPC